MEDLLLHRRCLHLDGMDGASTEFSSSSGDSRMFHASGLDRTDVERLNRRGGVTSVGELEKRETRPGARRSRGSDDLELAGDEEVEAEENDDDIGGA